MYNRLLTKAFNSGKDKKYSDSYDKNNYNLFVKQLGITEAEEAELTSKTYTYGFSENAPYEILASGEYYQLHIRVSLLFPYHLNFFLFYL